MIIVDNEKLAYGLEVGIGETSTAFSYIPAEHRLRKSSCGLVSSAIHEYAKREGLPSKIIRSEPGLVFDEYLQHAVTILGEEEDTNPLIVDASYSQFLGFGGITTSSEQDGGVSGFPEEKVIDFRFSERDAVVDWLSETISMYKQENRYSLDTYGFKLDSQPISSIPDTTIKEALSDIWDPNNFKDWNVPYHVKRDGIQASLRIPRDAILSS